MKHVYTFLMILGVIVSFYLLASFVSWEANPKNWSLDGRYFVGTLSFLLSGWVISLRCIS
jgi:hypothetical protein